jgi:predicted transcriptional regulator of viral defense system
LNSIEKKISLTRALTTELGGITSPVISSYQLGRLVFEAYSKNSIGNANLRLKKNLPDRQQYSTALRELLDAGVLSEVSGLSGNYFKLLGAPEVSADQIICAIDPFCYISHLSAMAYHGITDRLPRTVFVSSPPFAKWKEYALELMKKDLGRHFTQYIQQGFPQLTRPRPKKISGKLIEFKNSSYLGAYKNVPGRTLRVATIGRTFLDMISDPDDCGGIQHVIDVYKGHAKQYQRLIIDEVDRHGNGIEKARAGYLLEVQAGVTDRRLDEWQKTVQRGGSRKLDPSAEYSPFFSERWALSLNIPSISENAV